MIYCISCIYLDGQEECDIMSLVLAKYKGPINLSEFKAVMLASLRSVLPKDWAAGLKRAKYDWNHLHVYDTCIYIHICMYILL